MIAALDTDILAYAEGINDAPRRADARALIENVGAAAGASVIVFAELFQVLVRKGRRTHAQGREITLEWHRIVRPMAQAENWLPHALELAGALRLGLWDAAILDSAAEAGCELLLSEDLQHGFRWRGVTVVNPFAHPEHPLLLRFMASS